MADSTEGLLLEGRWRVERCLARGQRDGDIHAGRDEKTGARVTVVILPSGWVPQSIVEERRLAALIGHPAFVRVLDMGVVPALARAFAVVERPAGEPLSQLLELGPADLVEAVAVARGLLSALEAAHRHGVLLEVFSPKQVLVRHGPAGLDLTLAAPLAAERPRPLFDPHAAPERLGHTAAPPSVESAVFRVGALLHHMLAGERPFEGEDVFTLAASLASKKPAPIRAELGVPLPVQQALWRALEKDPNHRYHGFADFAAALSL